MPLATPLAWLQLRKEPLRLVVAVSGVTFAVVLIFVQLGFEQALFDSAVRYHTNLGYDVAIISPKTDFIVRPMSFPRSRLHQARGFPGVARVSPIYLGVSAWRNPANAAETRSIFVVGFDPEQAPFDLPGVRRHQADLRLPDRVLYDRLLHEVVEADPEAPGLTLSNTLAQEQARRLLAEADEYF